MRQSRAIPPLTAIGYADFVPTAGRVPFPDICCDLAWVRGEVYITGPESKPSETTFPGERVQLLRLDPFVARAWLGVPLGPAHVHDVHVDRGSRHAPRSSAQ